MKASKWVKQYLVAAALTLCATNASANESGAYLEVSYGKATFKGGDEIREAVGTFPTSGVDDSDTSYRLGFGYRFNRHVGIAVSYVDLGEAKALGQYSDSFLNQRVDLSIESKGLAFAVVPAIPSGSFEFNPRLGFYVSDTKSEYVSAYRYTSQFFSTQSTFRRSEDVSKVTLLYGLGMGFTIAEHFHLRVDWIRYSDVGDEDELGYEDDVDTLTAGFQYRF